jgi:hypothetical protein
MKNYLNAVRKTTDVTLDESNGQNEDLQPGYAMNFKQVGESMSRR